MHDEKDILEKTNRMITKINRVIDGEFDRGGWTYVEIIGVLDILKNEFHEELSYIRNRKHG